MFTRTIITATAITLVALTLGGCAATVADKTGGDTITLRFASIDGEDRGREFADAIEEASDGRITVDVAWVYGDGATEAEADMVQAIASGELDGGWPATRAFAAAGIPSLAAVEAPLLIANYEAQAALVEPAVSDEILATLDGSGVVGVGLAANPLRRPFAANAPLLGPDDWAGKRFRVYNSQTQDAAVRAIGAEPANLSFGWIDEVRAGRLDGTEFDVRGYWMNGYGLEAGNVASNVVLWPKVSVLAVSQQRWDTLSDQQREWIAEAARATAAASAATDFDEDATAATLCGQGVKFFPADAADLDALADAFAPVHDSLAADDATAAVYDVVRGVAAQHPGVAEIDVPEECSSGEYAEGVAPSSDDDGPNPLADGVYRTEVTADDVEGAGLSNGPGWSGTWTLTVRDGTYALTCRPIAEPGHDCGNAPYGEPGFTDDTVLEAGTLHGSESRVVFAYDADLHSELSGCAVPCADAGDLAYLWSMSGDELVLEDAGNAQVSHSFTLRPWKKIG